MQSDVRHDGVQCSLQGGVHFVATVPCGNAGMVRQPSDLVTDLLPLVRRPER